VPRGSLTSHRRAGKHRPGWAPTAAVPARWARGAAFCWRRPARELPMGRQPGRWRRGGGAVRDLVRASCLARHARRWAPPGGRDAPPQPASLRHCGRSRFSRV